MKWKNIEKEDPMSDFKARMKEIDETVESCDSLETAKALLHLTLMRIDGFKQQEEEQREFGNKVSSVFDDLLIMFEHHKRKGTSVEELDDVFRTLIAHPRITGPAHLSWYLNWEDSKIEKMHKKDMDEALERMEQHYKEYGNGDKEKHFKWLKGLKNLQKSMNK